MLLLRWFFLSSRCSTFLILGRIGLPLIRGGVDGVEGEVEEVGGSEPGAVVVEEEAVVVVGGGRWDARSPAPSPTSQMIPNHRGTLTLCPPGEVRIGGGGGQPGCCWGRRGLLRWSAETLRGVRPSSCTGEGALMARAGALVGANRKMWGASRELKV